MEGQGVWDRYRLAMAILPDEAAAAEIFMRARNEAELVRLAARWRQAHGLGPVERPAELPPLDPFQEEHALHLVRRARLRHRWFRAAAVSAPLVLLLVTAWGWSTWPDRKAELAPAFRRAPVVAVPLGDALRLSVYQVWVGLGEVTVWWELTGSGAERFQLAPALELPGMEGALSPRETEWIPGGPRRMAARSAYAVQVTTATHARLRFRGASMEWVLDAPLEGSLEQGLTVHPVPGKGVEPHAVWIQAVTVSPVLTRVRYEAPPLPGGRTAVPSEIQVGQQRLQAVRPGDRQRGAATGEAFFEPVPGGATRLTIHFAPASEIVGPVVYRLPAPEALSPVIRLGDRVQAIWRPDPNLIPRMGPGSMPYFTDQAGRRYEVLEIPPQGWDGLVQYSLVVLDPPPGVEFRTLTLPAAERLYPVNPVTIDLTRP